MGIGIVANLPTSAAAHASDKTVSVLSANWAADWHAKNLDAIMALYASDAAFQPASHERWDGTAAIRKNFANLLSQFNTNLRMQSLRSDASGDLGYDSGTYVEDVTRAKGSAAMHFSGSYLFLFQRQKNGEWKILEQTWTEFNPTNL